VGSVLLSSNINLVKNIVEWLWRMSILYKLFYISFDFGECQFCINCFIFLLTLANVNSVQIVLYFFWLWRMSILYKLFYISFDFGQCQFCTNCFIFLLTLANVNSVQTVLYFFLLMLYKLSPCHIFWLCAVVFLLFLIHLRQFFVYPFIKSNTPLTSVRMNLNHSATQAPRPWWQPAHIVVVDVNLTIP
jgi:hypothetical protein